MRFFVGKKTPPQNDDTRAKVFFQNGEAGFPPLDFVKKKSTGWRQKGKRTPW